VSYYKDVILPHGKRCSVARCNSPARYAQGLCSGHRHRLVAHGTVDADRPLRKMAPNGSGSVDAHGYRLVFKDGRRVREHRWIMEQHLGRALRADESVHHRNGDRLDNRIANLELRARYHGKGQSVPDLIAWAKEILCRYEPDALR